MDTYPLIKTIENAPAAAAAFDRIQDRLFSFFLDGGMDPQRLGRYSFIGSDPFLVLRSRGRQITLIEGEREEVVEGDPFEVLKGLLSRYQVAPGEQPVPFVGGAVGYFSYDLCHFIERLPTRAVDDLQLPECYLAFYDAVAGFDNLNGKAFIASTGFPETDERKRRDRARTRLEEIDHVLRAARDATPRSKYAPFAPRSSDRFRSNFSHDDYLAAVEAARQYIIAGDIFEVNLSQRFDLELRESPYDLYRRLRKINPAPFAAYLNQDGVVVVSASPERFLRLRGDLAETRPIKGTRPRGRTPSEDEALALELVRSGKDSAEHIMIVDLERNDLGRVCRFGTVRVSEMMALEKYATVFHLTSTVEGRLKTGMDAVDLLRASFPGGSITGAPKVRAMEIIDELEPTRRSVYTGAIGYLGFDGAMDLNIVIRTIICKDNRAYFQVGGAVVFDSDPEAEYQETLDKGRALMRALEGSKGDGQHR